MAISFKSKFGPTNRETDPGLRDTFKNTPLEPYVTRLMPFFFSEPRRKYDRKIKNEMQSDFSSYIRSLIDLATMLHEIKGKQIFGSGWTIMDRSDSKAIYASVEELFLDRLDELEDHFEDYEWMEELGEALDDLRKALSDFPWRENFEFEDRELDEEGNEVEYGWKHLSKTELEYIIRDLKSYEPAVRKFYVAEQDSIQVRFIKYALEHGVPKSRKIYRELYKFLDCFECIPAEIKKSHSTTISTRDPESNYIKSIVTRIEKKSKNIPPKASE